MRRQLALVAMVCVLTVPRTAFADEDIVTHPPPVNLHISSNSTLRTDVDQHVAHRLPPGYFFDEGTFDKLDAELRRLQEQETRLTAENESLRDSSRHYFPGWVVVGAAVAAGIAAGIWIGVKIQ